MNTPFIYVTNDDGIGSPGLRAMVEAVLGFGEVIVVAPLEQQSSKGRGLGGDRGASFHAMPFEVEGRAVEAYAFDGTPAQTVLHAFDVFAPERPPRLVVSGINYGENLGNNVTISGTVGAALESASHGVPALAVSIETHHVFNEAYGELDWRSAIHFAGLFARHLINGDLPHDVDVLNVVIPGSADATTPWRLTRQSRLPYFSSRLASPTPRSRIVDTEVGVFLEREQVEPDSDIYATLYDRIVSVTPLSLDCTSRTDMDGLDGLLRSSQR